MRHSLTPLFTATLLLLAGDAPAQTLEADVAPLVEASCVRCHGERTITPLNLSRLGYDLEDHDTFKAWEKVFDRLQKGEMPPATAPQADAALVDTAMGTLGHALTRANLAARGESRTPLRRLTRLEYAYTLQDLLGIDEAVASELSLALPAEADSGNFDTMASSQRMSPLHVQAYLDVAEQALDSAIVLGPPPPMEPFVLDYVNSRRLAGNSKGQYLGGGAVKHLEDGFATFAGSASTFLLHTRAEGYAVPYPGRYRVTVDAYAYQADTPVTLTMYQAKGFGPLSLDNLIGAFDMESSPRTVELIPFLRPGDILSPSVTDAQEPPDDSAGRYFQPDLNVRDYKGEGLALRTMTIEGPLVETWPPRSTRNLLAGVTFLDPEDALSMADGEIELTRDPYSHIVDIVAAFAPRAFRRPVDAAEVTAYADLARPLLETGRPFADAVTVSLRAILSAPPFLFHGGDAGKLDDFSLATRLSYFLWRSMPDAELFELAEQGRLADPKVLAAQVDRLLDSPKSERFVRDFAGQAYRLYELNATAPDGALYPEYDDQLGQAMAQETELFLTEIISENLGASALIDADFTFVNRRLAEHYGIEGIEGQQMRKVALAADSPRGGLLAQASIHKITANGTTTSPIPRGNFVLASLLGKPAPPPPAGVTALEPDTRGATTIREQLDAHRSSPVCASCHRSIDPPGYALEAFDPIGGFRKHYRVARTESENEPRPRVRYREGLEVNTSGVTPEGSRFAGIEDYKQLLLQQELDQVARHLASSLLAYSTGAEVEFADRTEVEWIIEKGRAKRHPVRAMIHQVVQSDLFQRR